MNKSLSMLVDTETADSIQFFGKRVIKKNIPRLPFKIGNTLRLLEYTHSNDTECCCYLTGRVLYIKVNAIESFTDGSTYFGFNLLRVENIYKK